MLACLDYAARYLQGLHRAILGETVSTPEEHARLLRPDDLVGEGYRDRVAMTALSAVRSEQLRIP